MALKLLSRAEILQAPDIQTETVDVPEWGGSVLVRGLSGDQRDAYEESLMTGKGQARDVKTRGMRVKLVVRCIVDEAGVPLFTEADVEALTNKSSAPLQRLFTVAQRLCGFGDKAEAASGND